MKFLLMVKSVVKNLVRGPVTERYPFVPKKFFKGTRGQVLIEIKKCIFCGLCQRKCPSQAIVVTKDKKNWEIDRLRCVSCAACVDVCPVKCLAMDTKYAPCSDKRYKDAFNA
ncbi:MAG: 4Fe-4S dicluster domain-containing protein [Candidatus Omnitrophica bacterium]|nr:4Fe-4S dicluster domain-containing protein [Candidatus Omnitrophota bacterium]